MVRNTFWDYVKGVTILMVIVGHQIQYSTGSGVFFNDIIFKFIYSFHMPLFMFVSGFFFYNSVNKHSSLKILKNKSIQLILPIITFTIVSFLLTDIYSFNSLLDNGSKNISKIITGQFFNKSILFVFLKNLWFLWVVFYLNCFVIVVRTYLKDSILFYIFFFLILFFIPDYYICNMFCFMYPFFITGYLLNKYGLFRSVFDHNKSFVNFSIILLFVILLLFYNTNTYIYTTGYSIIGKNHQIIYDIHRLLIGYCGVYSTIWILLKLKNKNINIPSFIRKGFLYLGKNTKQLYIVTSLPIFLNILGRFATGEVNYFKSLIATIVITIVSMPIIELIKKINWANLIVFGQWNFNKTDVLPNNDQDVKPSV